MKNIATKGKGENVETFEWGTWFVGILVSGFIGFGFGILTMKHMED